MMFVLFNKTVAVFALLSLANFNENGKVCNWQLKSSNTVSLSLIHI